MKKVLLCILTMVILLSLGCKDNSLAEQSKEQVTTQPKKLVVGIETGFAPFAFVKDGQIVGYEPDIIRQIAQDLNIEVEFLDVPFSGLLTGLEAKKFDFVVSGITVTPERQEKYNMTVPTAEDSMAVLKLKDNTKVNTIADLDGKIVATAQAGVSEEAAKKLDEKLKAEGKNGLKEIKLYQSLPDAHLDLKNKRVDVVIQSLPTLYSVVKNQPDTYEIVGTIGDELYISFAVGKENKKLTEFLNEQILRLKENGKLKELQEKWFGTTFNLPDELPSK